MLRIFTGLNGTLLQNVLTLSHVYCKISYTSRGPARTVAISGPIEVRFVNVVFTHADTWIRRLIDGKSFTGK